MRRMFTARASGLRAVGLVLLTVVLGGLMGCDAQVPPTKGTVKAGPAAAPATGQSDPRRRKIAYLPQTETSSVHNPDVLRQRIQAILESRIQAEGCEAGEGLVAVELPESGVVRNLQVAGVLRPFETALQQQLGGAKTRTRGKHANARVAFQFKVE